MKLTFRNVEEKDWETIKEIYDWYAVNSIVTFHTEPVSINILREYVFIDHPRYRSFMIYDGDELAGYTYFTFYKKRPAYDRSAELAIYLKPDYCGKGIGSEIIPFMEEEARKAGLKNILAVVTKGNDASVALFDKFGFERCAYFKNIGEKLGQILDVIGYQKEL